MHHALPADFKQSTNHRENGERQRINTFAGKKQEELSCDQTSTVRQWLRIRIDIPVAHGLRIRADIYYLFTD